LVGKTPLDLGLTPGMELRAIRRDRRLTRHFKEQ
jgi:hypothetical protein